MKFLNRISIIVFLFSVSACRLTDLDANLENPNEVGVSNLDVNLLMNKIQSDFGQFVSFANIPSMELSRMLALTGGDVYQRAYQPQSFNDIWNTSYQDVLIQIETLLGRTDGTGFTVHSGSARVIRAYTLLTLVDLFNDVPYSEALNGPEGAFNPKVDGGKSIYEAAIADLDAAIELLAKTPGSGLTRDIYFAGDRTKWTALANTLKLKAYINLRLTDPSVNTKIEALLSQNLIDTDAEAFTYKYGTADIPARSRHPLYRDMYSPQAGGAGNYLSNHYMFVCYKSKGVEDPRWRHYFYRQVGSIAKALDDEPESIPCRFVPAPSHYPAGIPFCSFDPGFFGRDHGNNDGLPPDSRAKTCFGVYPAGGRSDVNTAATYQGVTQQGQGANGAGIEPIWMPAFTEFLKAEAALTLSTTGDARALMTKGIYTSVATVKAFAAAKGQTVPASLLASDTAYVTAVQALYDAASTTDAKMDVVMTEYYIALWGNGIESYNLYRRTGKPDFMQPMRAGSPGAYWRSLIYPADFVNLNSTAVQKSNTGINKVFWDNNPDDFVQ